MPGVVHRLHRKPETPGERGLPKPSVSELDLTPTGVVGDFNRFRHEENADDPTSAVLIMTLETLHSLGEEGWPVQPGDLGENITTRGVAYTQMGPGTNLRVGVAQLTVTRPCEPCTNLYLLPYVGKERGPQFLKVMLGRRGWYCRVSRSGVVRVNDPIQVGIPRRLERQSKD